MPGGGYPRPVIRFGTHRGGPLDSRESPPLYRGLTGRPRRRGTTDADDADRIGRLAQRGEHTLHTRGVAGSIPAPPTIFPQKTVRISDEILLTRQDVVGGVSRPASARAPREAGTSPRRTRRRGGLDLPVGGEHRAAERRQGRAAPCPAAMLRGDERAREHRVHLLDQQPGPPVGHPHDPPAAAMEPCSSIRASNRALPGPKEPAAPKSTRMVRCGAPCPTGSASPRPRAAHLAAADRRRVRPVHRSRHVFLPRLFPSASLARLRTVGKRRDDGRRRRLSRWWRGREGLEQPERHRAHLAVRNRMR